MTHTSQLVNNALKVSLVFKGHKFQGDISKSTRITPDFIRLKGKMTTAAIGTVVSYLEKDQEKLRDVTITGLADAVRWVDRPQGAFTILEPNMGHNVGQTSGSANVVNHHPNFISKIQSFFENPEDRWNFIDSFKLQSTTWMNNLLLLLLGKLLGMLRFADLAMSKQKVGLKLRGTSRRRGANHVVCGCS